MDLYFNIVSKQFNTVRPSLNQYRDAWKQYNSEITFHEYLGLTESLYLLLINDEDNFFKLMRSYWRLTKSSSVKMIDGLPYRLRRGKWVPINLDWLGQITTKKTIRNRPSKLTNKLKNKRKRCATNY